jgi:hypothetical protein
VRGAGNLFLTSARAFRVYGPFMENFRSSSETLQKCDNETFRRFLQGVREDTEASLGPGMGISQVVSDVLFA